MILKCALRRLKHQSIFITVFFISLLFVFYQLKVSEYISQDQYSSFTKAPEETFSMKPSMRGVHPESLHKYKPNSNGRFNCLDTREEISYSKLNDDYCDCTEDGSDEPGTSACGFNFFHCPKADLFILTSRVNDGICDCCDGSDEYLNLEPPMFLAGQRHPTKTRPLPQPLQRHLLMGVTWSKSIYVPPHSPVAGF